jgi:hypothetical protein
MKKTLVVFLALVWVGAMAFADTAPAPQGQFHAWNEGQYIIVGSLEGGPVTTGWGPGWDKVGGLDQEWTFKYDGQSFGFDATIEFGSADFANVAGWSIYGVDPLSWFGTYFNFSKWAKLYVGKPRFNDYSFLSYINGSPTEQRLMDSQWGANLQFFPLTGLALQVTGFVPPATISASGPHLNFGANFSAGAKYSVPDLGAVFAYYKAIQNDNTTGVQTYGASNDATIENKMYVDVGLQYVGMPKLGIQGEVAYDFSNVGGSATGVDHPLAVYVGATTSMIDNTKLSLDAFLHSISGSGVTSYTVFSLEANGQYDFPKGMGWGVGLNLGYDGGAGGFNGGNGETPLAGYAGAGFLLQPYVVYTADGGAANVKVSFLYVSGGVNNEATGNVKTKASWGIPIVYTWSF